MKTHQQHNITDHKTVQSKTKLLFKLSLAITKQLYIGTFNHHLITSLGINRI